MEKSIYQIVSEHKNVLNTRERLEEMFSKIADCHVTIGGSYMLKYWCEAFSEREVSDYDFILHALPENMEKIDNFLSIMNGITGWIGGCRYYDRKSFYFGYCNGLRINIILESGKYCPCANFESLKDIINVKKEWCEEAIKQGKRPRYKDVEDIATYEAWEAENDLPF